MPSLVCPAQLSEEAISVFPTSLPALDLKDPSAASAYSKLNHSFSLAAGNAQDLLRVMRKAWNMSQNFSALASTDSSSNAAGSYSEPSIAAQDTSIPSLRELSDQVEIMKAQLGDMADPSAQPSAPTSSGSNGLHSQHIAEATSALKKTMEQIKTGVLSGKFSAAGPLGVDECLMSMARGFLRRDESYVKEVFRKHSKDLVDPKKSGESQSGLLKGNMRAALKDAHFPLVSGPLATSDDELMRQVDLDKSDCVSFEEFRQFVLQRGSVENWMKSEQFLQILSDSVAPLLGMDAGPDDQMRLLAQLSPDQIRQALNAAVIGLNTQFESSQENLKKTLKAVTAQTERLSQSKFEVNKLACGKIDDFHKGLESRIGTPGLDFENEMYAEHCTKFGCNLRFTTGNYGINTSAFEEWMYAVGKKSVDGKYTQKKCPPKQLLDKQGELKRTIDDVQMYIKMLEHIEMPKRGSGSSYQPSNDLEQRLLDAILAAKLRKEEIFAIVLYTGPNYHLYNSILRRSPDALYKLFSNGHKCPSCNIPCNVMRMSNFFVVESPNRVCSKCGNNSWCPWSERAEGIHCESPACSIQHMLCPRCVDDLPTEPTDSGNLFTTTIFALVSAIQKLSRTMVVPPGTLLYRGMGGTLDMPDCFYDTDEHGCSGYCELAFMSTSGSRTEAITYSGLASGKPKAAIMVIHPSSVDRGAYISDFSQYKKEKEYLWPPFSFVQSLSKNATTVEVIGDAVLTIVTVRVNANLKTETLDELEQKKKNMHLKAFQVLIDDAQRLLQERKIQNLEPADDQRISAIRELKKIRDDQVERPNADFLDNKTYNVLVSEMLDVHLWSIEQLERDSGQPLSFNFVKEQCKKSVDLGFKRRDREFLKSVFEKHKDVYVGFTASGLEAALLHIRAPHIPNPNDDLEMDRLTRHAGTSLWECTYESFEKMATASPQIYFRKVSYDSNDWRATTKIKSGEKSHTFPSNCEVCGLSCLVQGDVVPNEPFQLIQWEDAIIPLAHLPSDTSSVASLQDRKQELHALETRIHDPDIHKTLQRFPNRRLVAQKNVEYTDSANVTQYALIANLCPLFLFCVEDSHKRLNVKLICMMSPEVTCETGAESEGANFVVAIKGTVVSLDEENQQKQTKKTETDPKPKVTLTLACKDVHQQQMMFDSLMELTDPGFCFRQSFGAENFGHSGSANSAFQMFCSGYLSREKVSAALLEIQAPVASNENRVDEKHFFDLACKKDRLEECLDNRKVSLMADALRPHLPLEPQRTPLDALRTLQEGTLRVATNVTSESLLSRLKTALQDDSNSLFLKLYVQSALSKMKICNVLARYDIKDGQAHLHRSATCTIYEVDRIYDDQKTRVVLKFMSVSDDFERELRIRSLMTSSPSDRNSPHLPEMFESYRHTDGDAEFLAALRKYKWMTDCRNPCLIVMRAADRNLSQFTYMELQRLTQPAFLKDTFFKILQCVKALHDKGIVHGDLTPRNIVVQGQSFSLIDFDSSSDIGMHYSWSKRSSAYLPPEAMSTSISVDCSNLLLNFSSASSSTRCMLSFQVSLPVDIESGSSFTISFSPVNVTTVHALTIDDDAFDYSSCIIINGHDITVASKDAIRNTFCCFKIEATFDSLPAAGSISARFFVSSVAPYVPLQHAARGVAPDVTCECTCDKILLPGMRNGDSRIAAGCTGLCGLAHVSHDMWALGVILYRLCAGRSLWSEDDEDNIKDDAGHLLELALWTDEFKEERLQKIEDTVARRLVSQLLEKEPWKRPCSIDDLLAIPFTEIDAIKLKLQEMVPMDAFQSSNLVGSVKDLRTGKFSHAAFGLRSYLKVAADWDEAAACTLQGMQDEVDVLKDCPDCAQVQADVLQQLIRGEAAATKKLASALAELKEQRKNGATLAAADVVKALRSDISTAGGWHYGMPNSIAWPYAAVKDNYGSFTKIFSQPMCRACQDYCLDYSSIFADLHYVMHEAAVEKKDWIGIRDHGRANLRLADFMALKQAVEAQLTDAELAAIRFYTSLSFNALNIAMRDQGRNGPHPLPGVVMNLQRGLKKLRALGSDDASSKQTVVLWRGMSHMQLSQRFNAEGGTELAPMSTTTDVSVAISYAVKKDTRSALLFRFVTRNNLERGADVQWLSMFPGESETVFPPLTFFQRTRTEPQVIVYNGITVTIVEMGITIP